MKKTINENNSKFIIDAELLPLMEKADNGCFDSLVEMCQFFRVENDSGLNNEIAIHYEQKLFEITDDNRLKTSLLWNKAIGYRDFGNYEQMVEQFHKVIDFMQENIPMEKWDFSLFAIIEEYSQLRR